MAKSITKEEINALDLIAFEGPITVVTDAENCEKVARHLMDSKVLGFDTECKPTFRKGDFHPTALLQLSNESEAFLFRLNMFKMTDSLLQLLSSADVLKVGVAVNDDIKGLQKLSNFKAQGFVEIGDLAKKEDINQLGLRSLTAIKLGRRLSKKAQLSNWEAKNLTHDQLVYAATDAWTGLLLYNSFQK